MHRTSFAALDELFGEFSALFYALRSQLFAAATREELDAFEAALRARAGELAERECGKLRILARRRWKARG